MIFDFSICDSYLPIAYQREKLKQTSPLSFDVMQFGISSDLVLLLSCIFITFHSLYQFQRLLELTYVLP